MLIREIFLQSIGPFLKSRRFQFDNGTNIILGANGTGKTPLSLALQNIFNNEIYFKNKELFKPWIPQDESAKIGIIFQRNDRTFKLIKAPEKNNSALFEKINNKLDMVAKGPEIEDFFIDELDLPLGNDFIASSFVSNDLSVTNKKTETVSGFTDDPWMTGNESYDGSEEEKSISPKERLEELQNELKISEDIEEKEFKLEGLEKKLFEINEKLREIEELQNSLKKVMAFLQKNTELQNFPTDFENKIQNLKEAKREMESLEEELNEEEEIFQDELEDLKDFKKFHKDPIFDIIAAITLAGFILPFVTTFVPGWTVFFGLGGLAATIYWIIVRYPSKEKYIKTKEEEHKKEIKPKKDKFNSIKSEIETINSITNELGIKDSNELISLIKKFYSAIDKKNELESTISSKKQELDFNNLDQLRNEINRDIEQARDELKNMGRPTMDIITLRQEIKKYEKMLGKTKEEEELPYQQQESFSDDFGFNKEEEKQTPEAYKKILEKGLKLSRHQDSTFIGYVLENFEKYLLFLSDKRYVKPEIDEQFNISCYFKVSDKEINWETLSQGDLYIIYFALFFAIQDILVATRNLPLILDYSFIYFDDKTFIKVLKLIKKLSSKTQVILFNRRELSAKIANKVIKLETVDELI